VNKRRWMGALTGSLVLAVAAATHDGKGRMIDRRLFLAANQERGPVADGFFKGITELGSIWACVGAAAALTGMGRRRQAADALGAAAVAWSVGQILKRVTLRPRPYRSPEGSRLLIGEPSGTSWPSSHPAVLLAFVTVVGRGLKLSPGARRALAGLAGLVGVSRIYLGVHYPADVVGGLLMGRAVADLWHSSPVTLGTVDG
jgi:membrane-associated phospholipid phosphatase